MNEKRIGIVEMSSAMTIAGTIGLFVVLAGMPAVDIVFWRCVFGAASLALFCSARGVFSYRLSMREWLLAIVGGVAIVINWLFLFGALTRASIAIATTVYNTQPFILLGFGALVLGEKITAAKLLWLGLAFIGLILVVQVGWTPELANGQYLMGVAMALGAALCWAITAITTKKSAGTPPHLIALVQVVVGTIMLAPLANLTHLPRLPSTWAIFVLLGVVHTGLVYVLMYDAIHRLPTHVQGAISFIYPVVAIGVDYVVLHHTMSPMQIAGMVAILASAAGMIGALPIALLAKAMIGSRVTPHTPSEKLPS